MKITTSFPLPLLLLISNCFPLASSKSSLFNLTTDQDALFAFKSSTPNPNAIIINNWTTQTPICNWIGVTCAIKHRRVAALNLRRFNLTGTIAPHLGNLTFLQSLDLSFNDFTGILPSELSNLRFLEEISVGANNLTGDIPPWLGALSQLRHLLLYSNRFVKCMTAMHEE